MRACSTIFLLFLCTAWALQGIAYRSDVTFNVELSSLALSYHINGGAGGVYVLKDPEGKMYTLKFNRDISHFQEEILADKLYSVLGVATPRFAVIKNFTSLAGPLQDLVKTVPYARIAEYIEADSADNSAAAEDLLAQHFANFYVIDAFMANRDANKPGNTIRHNGVYYRIDNGGSLRNRSIGKKKGTKKSDHWDAHLIPEIKTFVRYHPDLYGKITHDEMLAQARHILSRARVLLDSYDEVATALMLENGAREDILQMLQHRLRLLQMLLKPGTSFPAQLGRPVSALTGAGAFIVCEIDGIQHVLLGERKSDEVGHDKKWVTFGGKSEFKQDKTLVQTAYRELYEETLGMINLEKEFEEAPFHDLVRPEYHFRQFFVRLPVCTDVQDMKQARVPPSLRHNHHTGDLEYHRFKWFPISVVRNTSARGEIGNTEYTAYHAFALNLQVPHMQWVLQQLEEKREINEHRHVQTAPGIAGTPAVGARSAPVYAEFEQFRP